MATEKIVIGNGYDVECPSYNEEIFEAESGKLTAYEICRAEMFINEMVIEALERNYKFHPTISAPSEVKEKLEQYAKKMYENPYLFMGEQRIQY